MSVFFMGEGSLQPVISLPGGYVVKRLQKRKGNEHSDGPVPHLSGFANCA